MVRRMTPAQFRAAVQKAQREQKRAVDKYNREVRTYNSKARAHHQQVESQRRRINQEIARLNARPASTTFTAYRASTATLVRTYSTVESSLASRSVSPAAQRFVDLASDETANSVYLVNALDGDGAPEDDPTEDELRVPLWRPSSRLSGRISSAGGRAPYMRSVHTTQTLLGTSVPVRAR